MKQLTLAIAILCFAIQLNAAEEFGIASFYSNKFQGKKTASGDIYQKDKMTCAHKTLPFGTLIKVTRLDNNKSVKVRVNDRGPYVNGWITDVSYKAALALEMIGKGSVKVKLEVLEYPKGKVPEGFQAPAEKEEAVSSAPVKQPELVAKGVPATVIPKETPKSYSPSPAIAKKTTTAPVKPTTPAKTITPPKTNSGTNGYGLYKIQLVEKQTGFAVQVSSLREYENMLKLVAELQKKGQKNVMVSVEKGTDAKPVYKVLLGAYGTSTGAEKAMNEARKKKVITDGYVINLNSLHFD